MATAKQSKHSKNPAPIINNKGKRELSPIGKELLNHCNARQPVLLYGKGNIDRKDLIRDVHKANGGIDAYGEYFDDDGKLTTREKLKDEFKGIYKSKSSKKKNKLDIPLSPMSYDIKEQGFLDRHFLSTPRTGDYVDCGTMMTAKEIYIELVIDAGIISEAKIDEASKMLLDKYLNMDIARMNEGELRSIRDGNSLSSLYARFNGETIEAKPVYKGYLFQCKGNLFIDNIPKPTSSEDKKYYCQLAKIIIDRALGYESTAFNWLAAYTHDDPKDFDKYFVERFEPIPLDRKEVVVESATKTYKDEQRVSYPVSVEVNRHSGLLKCNNKKVKLLPIRIKLLKFLDENKDNFVKRDDIYDHLWGKGAMIYEQQITDHIKEIIGAFVKIEIGYTREEIKKHIIETVKGSEKTKKKGGYIFHSNMVSLHWV